MKWFAPVLFKTALLVFFSLCLGMPTVYCLPMKVDIENNDKQIIAKLLLYIDFVEILQLDDTVVGKVGFVTVDGKLQLFLVAVDEQKTLLGWAAHKKIYNSKDELMGYYDWTSYWVYAYGAKGEKLGRAKCIVFKGVCAASITAILNQMLNTEKRS